MSEPGWKHLLAGWPWFHGEGRLPIPSYSERVPPPRLVRKPYGTRDFVPLADEDPWGWPITEYEDAFSLRPGLEQVARPIVTALTRLVRGRPDHGIPDELLRDNPCWPAELAERAGQLPGDREVVLLSLSLSRTTDDHSRVRWTLLGGSEQGPAEPFWKSFFSAPGRESPPEQGLAFIRRLLAAHGTSDGLINLRDAGFRILPLGNSTVPWAEGLLPSWVEPFLWEPGQSLRPVRYLLTFRPFAGLPAPVRRAYREGELRLLPSPASLLFWNAAGNLRLVEHLPLALQIPLLHLVPRHEGTPGLRVPECGWFDEPGPNWTPPVGRSVHMHRRTSRHPRSKRDANPLADARDHPLTHTLFSTDPNDLGLYEKPRARNVQLWTADFRPMLDGPRATAADIRLADRVVADGGRFGYRFVFPGMRVGLHELTWHRPLAAYATDRDGEVVVLHDGPLGYLLARPTVPDGGEAIELWPRPLRRDLHVINLEVFENLAEEPPHQTLQNVRKILRTRESLGPDPLPHSFARQLLHLPGGQTLDRWLDTLPASAPDPARARLLADELRRAVTPSSAASRRPQTLTFARTARRSFEVAYWNTIAYLSGGHWINKNNADCILDAPSAAARTRSGRELELLGDYLLQYHTKLIRKHGLEGRALAGEEGFAWNTEYSYPWWGGWEENQEGRAHERNLVVVIPGRDRSRAVIMADHYDTAYRSDYYEPDEGGTGARLAAPGADDNGSATAALMLAAPLLLDMSREGRLDCDVWLVHLTGEEFPAEGLGARRLCQQLVEGTLSLRLPGGKSHDLSRTTVCGTFVLDMVAHNTHQGRDIFQIAPGASRESLCLALLAHEATEAWNAWTAVWNRRTARRDCGRGRRSRTGKVPVVARHPQLSGEVRPHYDARSTLFNTDAQTFSDAGIPVVLFMENYDTHRDGYHDSDDTMANIDLDYGAALAAITIETVARAASGMARK